MKNIELLQSAIRPVMGSFQAQMSSALRGTSIVPPHVTLVTPNPIGSGLSAMTKEQLIQMASDTGIKVAKSWTKAKMIEALSAQAVD